MAYLLLAIGTLTLFGLSLLSALSGFSESAFKYGFLGLVLVAFSTFYIFYIKPRNEKSGKDELLEWLVENQEMVSQYGARYKDEQITNETVLVRFAVVYSALIFTRKTYTKFYVVGSNTAFNIKLFSTMFNFVMGWWAIPDGIIETPKSIYENLSDKNTLIVKDFLKNKHLYL